MASSYVSVSPDPALSKKSVPKAVKGEDTASVVLRTIPAIKVTMRFLFILEIPSFPPTYIYSICSGICLQNISRHMSDGGVIL